VSFERDSNAPHGAEPRPRARAAAGLCPECKHVRIVRSAKGSTFLLCDLSKRDPRWSRYPAQPRMECAGFER